MLTGAVQGEKQNDSSSQHLRNAIMTKGEHRKLNYDGLLDFTPFLALFRRITCED